MDTRKAPKVLVVDDDEISRELAVDIAKALDYEADSVASCEALLAAAENVAYDAILLDWQLPDASGTEATHRFRDREKALAGRGRTPVIAVTGNTEPGFRELCLAAGMDDYLPKPFSIDEFESMLARWVGNGRP